jgi:hypothetical protein
MWRPTLLCLAVLAAGPAAAQELSVEPGDCKSGVRLSARNVPVSRVLAQLSEKLGFELELEAPADRLVDVDMKRPAPELVRKLLAAENVVYSEAPDPRCPGQSRLVKLWLLPAGAEGPPRPRELTPMDRYRQAHGLPLEDAPAEGEAAEKPAE